VASRQRQFEDVEGSSQSGSENPAKRPKVMMIIEQGPQSQEWPKSQEGGSSTRHTITTTATTSSTDSSRSFLSKPAPFATTPSFQQRFIEHPAVSVLMPAVKDTTEESHFRKSGSPETRGTPPPIEELTAQAQRE